MKKIVALLCIIFIGGCIYADPFGLEFGWSIEEMIEANVQFVYPTIEDMKREKEEANLEDLADSFYSYDIIPPNPSELFPFYKVKINSELGLYEIEAYDGSIIVYEDDPMLSGNKDNYAISEDKANDIFDRTYKALLIKYGEDTFYNSEWISLDDWKMWDNEDTTEHLDIDLNRYESKTKKDLFSEEDYENGLYTVTLTYNKSEYLQALKDVAVL